MAETQKAREENLRLEALKVANTLYGGRGVQRGKFLEFAAEVYEFIKGESEELTEVE